jgi:hypothetical protein
MIPHYYDAARVVEIMRENGEIESKPINQPATNEAGQPVDGMASRSWTRPARCRRS